MEIHGLEDFVILVPIVPLGVVACHKIPPALGNMKCATLTNKVGDDIARPCH